VTSEKRVITVELTHNARRNAYLSVDGGKALKINMGDEITIRKSPLVTQLLRLKNHSFYDVVNRKFKNG
jgi:NAD+ kinase